MPENLKKLIKFLESLTKEERKIFWRHQDALHEKENLEQRLSNLDQKNIRMPHELQDKLKDFLSSNSQLS